ncbi:MAG: sulfurtransferase [Proteobacteria bacterium]|nr:sulfurtransferase [Pseudomonadota bacterium]
MNEGWSLKTLVNQFDLPTAQIVFMEIQIDAQQSRVKEITAIEAQELIAQNPELAVLDVRENWEHHYGSLPRSQALDRSLLDSILEDWKKDRPILIYCHFGVRSMDASNYFSEEGFDSVYTIRGGIDAWSVQVDPTLPRYSGSYC